MVKIAAAVRTAREADQHHFDFCLRTCWQMASEWLYCGDPLEAFQRIVEPKIGDVYTFGDVRTGLREAVALLLSETI